jgi:uncharacterized SAM-binding protein YcdF (DUF218 family)
MAFRKGKKSPKRNGFSGTISSVKTNKPSASLRSTKRYFGLLTRKERWGLSLKGYLMVFVFILLAGLITFLFIPPFLSVTRPVDSNVLVVEGWVHDFTVDAAVAEFKKGKYDHVFSTGGPIEGQGGYINDFNTYASIGADKLLKKGMPDGSVQMVPSHVLDRDRTYSSAIALRDWFHDHNLSVKSINVVTEDAHARRTRLLFQKAFGKEVKVGIISIPNPDYDAKQWWRYSEGVREVIGESLAYVYARFFFWP